MRKFWLLAVMIGMVALVSVYGGGKSEIKGNSDKKPKAVMTEAPKVKETNQPKAKDGRPLGYNPDLRYDPDFQVNFDVKQISGYKVEVEKRGNPFAMFFDKEQEHWNIGTYNYERQYWVWTLKHFDPSVIDLGQLYTKIDLSKTELNRLKPDILSIWGYIEAEKQSYDYSEDPEFSRFVDYLKKQKVSENIVDDYIHLASNPGKRGAALPLGHYYEESEVGFQPLHLVHNTPDDPSDNYESFIVGGMELYFRLHTFDFVPSFRGGPPIFLETKSKRNRPFH